MQRAFVCLFENCLWSVKISIFFNLLMSEHMQPCIGKVDRFNKI